MLKVRCVYNKTVVISKQCGFLTNSASTCHNSIIIYKVFGSFRNRAWAHRGSVFTVGSFMKYSRFKVHFLSLQHLDLSHILLQRQLQKLLKKLLNLEFRIFYHSSFAVKSWVPLRQLLEGVFKPPTKPFIYIHFMIKRMADKQNYKWWMRCCCSGSVGSLCRCSPHTVCRINIQMED